MKTRDENKRRVLVLGNGFDLAVNRKTNYSDFYKSPFCPKTYPSGLIRFLNERSHNIIRWLDLENAIQEYAIMANQGKTPDFFSKDEIKVLDVCLNSRSYYINKDNLSADFIYDTSQRLLHDGIVIKDSYGKFHICGCEDNPQEYFDELKKDRLDRDKNAIGLLTQDLNDYLNALPNETSSESIAMDLIKDFVSDSNSTIYSFNYTRIGCLLTDDEEKAKDYDKKIKYVHGSLVDGDIIIGAKDGCYGDYDFLQKSFCPTFNPPALLRDMQLADEVVIFGHSLGDCDRPYFESFFKQQIQYNSTSKCIRIYTYDDESKFHIKRNLQILTDKHYTDIHSLNDFKIITTR